MYLKKFMKSIVLASVIVLMMLMGVALRAAEAFSVDVKSFYYYDQFDAVSPARTIGYDFSGGSLSNNTIVIPDDFVTKKAADSGLSFVLTPYPVESGETNDISVALDTTGKKATLSTGTIGGCIISSTPSLPSISSASPGWTWTVQLRNFSGITDSTKEYGTQIGFASMTPGPHPELSANWRTGGTLEIDAVIYDDTGDGSEIWYSDEIFLTGQDPALTILDLQIIRPLPPNDYYITFEYSLNGGAWTTIGTYVIPEADRPNQSSFPARFPYVSLEEYAMGSPFQVHSHHWYNHGTPGDLNDTVYNAWLFVDDPGQANYSAVSVNSDGYLAETSLIFNAAAGYWELPAAVFSDNFNDNSINTTDWSASGSSVTESEGILKVSQDSVTDAGGKVLSRAFQINPYAPIVVQRKAMVHYADNNFDGAFALLFGDNTDFTTWENDTLSVVVSHANHDTASAHGFYLGSQPARFPNTFPATSEIWDNWFEEKIIYDPVSGLAELYIDGLQKASINLGALPAGTTYLKVYIDAWGATAGHYNYSDDLSVSQKYTGSPVFLSDNDPPASTVIFNFTATKKDSTIETVSQQITGYVQDFATNLLPAGAITNPTPTFSWMGITGASAYAVQLRDANWNHMWNKYDIPPTINSFVYNGPALESGKTYYYDIVSTIETNGMDNASFAQGSFTYTGTAPTTISFSGWVKTGPDWPSIEGMQPVVGATVNAVDTTGAPFASGTTVTDGSFAVTGIPAMATFRLVVPTPASTTYVPVLSKFMQWNADIQALLPFTLFTPAQYAAFGNTAGTGLIIGRVALANSPTTFLSGATIEAREYIPGTPPTLGAIYPVTYTGGSATGADGIYMVKNVPSGKMVQLVATLAGYTFAFNEAIIPAQAGFISEESFFVAETTHLEAATIQSRFEAAMARFNAGDFSQGTGFAYYISANYLDRGENKAQFVAAAELDHANGTLTWTIQSILGAGDYATMTLTWGYGEIDTLYFHKEGGVWLLYGNQELFDIWANSGHQMYSSNPYPYWVSLSVEDPEAASGITVNGVNVKGPGLPTEGISLYHDTSAGQWHSWSQNAFDLNLNPKWATEPTAPLDYVFTISYSGSTGTSPEVQTFQVKSFVNAAPLQASLAPVADSTATRPLTFSWGSAGEGYRYRVEVNDANYNRIWETDDLTGLSVTYDGPTLGGGQYMYIVLAQDGYGNSSMIFNSFYMPLLYQRTAVTSGTGVDNHPAWSPDGQKIAFTSNRSGTDNVWVVNRDGSGLSQLTTVTGYQAAGYPSWSPDGSKIAYILKDTSPEIGGFGAYFLYTMNAAGTSQQVRSLPENGANTYWDFDVKFTEWLDNDRIAFVSFGPAGGAYKLYNYRLSTGGVTQIIPNPAESNPDGDIYKISWNAATGKLAYDRWPIGIQTITDAGASYQVLDIPQAGQMDTPSMAGWRPDGGELAFVKNLYGVSNIGIFDMTTKSSIVEGTTTDDEWPVWSPDGGLIAFVSDGHIWTMTITSIVSLQKGDINGDGNIDLADAILTLKVMAGMNPTGVWWNYPFSGADVNGDGKVGLQEVLYILQYAAGMRQ